MNKYDVLDFGKKVMAEEAQGILHAVEIQSDLFAGICRKIVQSKGKIVVSGVGKAGLIGKKISATMASTGTPSIWLDPINALHGDLGMVDKKDIALLISIGSAKLIDHMNASPQSILASATGGEAIDLMHALKVNALPVLDSAGKVVGLVDIQDLV